MKLKEKYEIYKIVSKNIKKYRLKKNLTQKEFAKKCGYSHSYIKKIEGSNSPNNYSILTLYNISLALDIELKSLFEDNNI